MNPFPCFREAGALTGAPDPVGGSDPSVSAASDGRSSSIVADTLISGSLSAEVASDWLKYRRGEIRSQAHVYVQRKLYQNLQLGVNILNMAISDRF